jgi:hypothetical protein
MKINAGIKNFHSALILLTRCKKRKMFLFHSRKSQEVFHGKMLFKFIGIKGLKHHRLGFLASTNDDSTKMKEKRASAHIRSIKFELSEPGKIIEIVCKAYFLLTTTEYIQF